MTPELDVRCDADLFVDRLYRIGQAPGPEVYVAAQLSRFVCDLNRDPDQLRNVVRSPGYSVTRQALAGRLDRLRRCSGVSGRDLPGGEPFCE